MKRKNIQLTLFIGLILVFGFLITSLASYYVSRTSIRQEISETALPLTADNIYSEIQRDLLRPVFISSLMASDTFLRDWVIDGEKDKDKIIKYLKEIKERYNTITSFFVSDITNNYYYSGGILKKVSPGEERDKWYYRVRLMENDYEINIDPDMANKDEMTIFVNYRVYDYKGNYIGATGVGLAVKAVKNLIKKYQEKYGRSIYFIDRDGNLKLTGREISEKHNNLQYDNFQKFYKDLINGAEVISFSYNNGKERIHTNARHIDEFGWILVVEQAEEKKLKPIFRTLLLNISISLVITVLVLILVVFIINVYQKDIDTLEGIIPICSYCKQIRDDKGFWNKVEEYVTKHTEAEFSHGICPECMEKHFPEMTDSES